MNPLVEFRICSDCKVRSLQNFTGTLGESWYVFKVKLLAKSIVHQGEVNNFDLNEKFDTLKHTIKVTPLPFVCSTGNKLDIAIISKFTISWMVVGISFACIIT